MRRQTNRLVCGLLAAALALGGTPAVAMAAPRAAMVAQASSVGTISWQRLGGATRYDTMQQVVDRSFAASNYAVVASGDNYPDALAASSLAGALSAPVIITETERLTPQAAEELTKLKVTGAYVVGGSQAVSAAVESEIRSLGITVTRLAGTDRQGTSAEVASEIQRLTEDGRATRVSDTAFVVSGSDFAGALSISPWAYRNAAPILLADASGALTSEAVTALAKDTALGRVVLVGDAVGEAPLSQLSLAGKTCSAERIGGATTVDVNHAACAWALQNGFAYVSPVVACGSKYPDALCGAALAAEGSSPLLLVDDLSDATWQDLGEHVSSVVNAFVLGGFSATPLVWSTDTDLNNAIDELFSQDVNLLAANPLELAYEYISTYSYETGDVYPEGDWREWSPAKAVSMYRAGAGNCYDYASLFTWAARRLGYDAKVVSGMTESSSQGQVPHSWSEVTIDGVRYVVDSERHHNYLDRDDLDFFLVTYAEAPIYYYDLAGNEYE